MRENNKDQKDPLENLINEEKQKEKIEEIENKIEEKEVQNEKDNDPLLLDIKLTNKQKEEKFKPEINYLNLNPFQKYTEAGVGIATLGLAGPIIYSSSEIIILSGIVCSGIGASILIPSLIGLGIYSYYKKNKNEKYIRFLNSLKNDSKMKEEKELFKEICLNLKKEINDIFSNDFSLKYNYEIKDNFSKYINNFIKEKSKESKSLNDKFEMETKDIKTLNVILLGKSGVGKSTLINEILKLKENRAEEQDNYEAKHIEGWAKKYPIKDSDTKVNNFNLWDTEGIEFSNDNQNNQENHLQKVIKHIKDHKTKPNEQINCIWYCLNGQTFQPSEGKYLEALSVSYNENFKIPIVYVYTQAYENESDKVEGIKKKLENLQSIKNNKEKLYYIDIIAKEKKYKNRKGKEVCEEPFNLDNLINETFNLSKKGMEIVTKDKINKFCFELNKKAEDFEKKIFDKKIKLYEQIMRIQEQNIINIFESTEKEFMDLIKEIFDCCEDNLKLDIKNNIYKIKEIILKIIEGKIVKFINIRNLKYLCDNYEELILSKYNKKNELEKNEKPLDNYKEEIKEYIIKPIFYSQNNYAIIEIYDIVINIILDPLFEEYNNFLKNTKNDMKTSMISIFEDNYKNFLNNSNLNEYNEIK